MTARARGWALAACATLTVLLLAARPAAAAVLDRGTAEAQAQAALADGHYGFCKKPSWPLSPSALRLCPLAGEIEGCEGFAKACEEAKRPRPPPSWLSAALNKLLGYVALGGVWIAVAAAAVVIVIAAYRFFSRAREDKAARQAALPIEPVLGTGPEPPAVDLLSEAEQLLAVARAHAAAGRLDQALFAYLGAALRALDDRGAIRIARHTTHGEYVRSCREDDLRPVLRAMVKDVDVVRFGGGSATEEVVERAGASAEKIVFARPAPALGAASLLLSALCLFCLAGCGGDVWSPNADPSGDDLFVDLLAREGATVTRLTGPLGALPRVGEAGPAVVVDTDRTPLDEETRASLLAWTAQGGVLVLAGDPEGWPKDLWAKRESVPESSRDARVTTPCPPDDVSCRPPRIDHVRLAEAAGMTWPHDEDLEVSASLETGELYAALRPYEKGAILGLASDELLTNAGLSVHGNPAAIVALLEPLEKTEFLVARRESGMAPPANPFAGLVRIGLGLGLAHGLVFALLLFLSAGIRHARPAGDPPPPRRAFAEHVRATGALYARARATGHALLVFARYADQQLRARAPRGVSPALFLAQRTGADPEETAHLYGSALESKSDDPHVAGDLHSLKKLSALLSKAMREGD